MNNDDYMNNKSYSILPIYLIHSTLDMEEEDYCNEYLDYLREIRNVITSLTMNYYTAIVDSFLQM